MPEAIVTRILRLAGYAAYAHEVDESSSRLTLWVRQEAAEPYYVCGGCGISIRDVHSWTERRVRDLPCPGGLGKSGWCSKSIGCAVHGAACAPSGCRSSRAKRPTRHAWRRRSRATVKRRR